MVEQDLGKEKFRPLKIYFRACEETSSAYFGRSLANGRELEKQVETMAKHLEKIGHTITSKDVVSWELQEELRQEAQLSENPNRYIFEHHLRQLEESDIAIFEVSEPSNVWEDCCMVHVLNMPVILLRYKASGYHSPTFLGEYSPLVHRFEYNNQNYPEVFKKALDWVETSAKQIQAALHF